MHKTETLISSIARWQALHDSVCASPAICSFGCSLHPSLTSPDSASCCCMRQTLLGVYRPSSHSNEQGSSQTSGSSNKCRWIRSSSSSSSCWVPASRWPHRSRQASITTSSSCVRRTRAYLQQTHSNRTSSSSMWMVLACHGASCTGSRGVMWSCCTASAAVPTFLHGCCTSAATTRCLRCSSQMWRLGSIPAAEQQRGSRKHILLHILALLLLLVVVALAAVEAATAAATTAAHAAAETTIHTCLPLVAAVMRVTRVALEGQAALQGCSRAAAAAAVEAVTALLL